MSQQLESTPNQEEIIDLTQYLYTIMSNKKKIIGLAFLFGVISILVVFSMTPIYSSTATLLIEPDSNNVVSIEEVYGMSSSDDEYYQTQYQILNSRIIAEKVISRLELQNHPEFVPEPGVVGNIKAGLKSLASNWLPNASDNTDKSEQEIIQNQVVEAFFDRLTISPVRDSQLVKIRFESESRQLAAKVANTVAEEYIKNDLNSRMQMTTKATDWLTDRLKSLKDELKNSEEKLQAFREQEKLVEAGGVTTMTAEQLSLLGDKLVSAQRNTAAAKADFDQISNLRDRSLDSLLSVPIVQKDPLVSNLREEELQASTTLQSLADQYGDNHPYMQQARSEYSQARANLQAQVNNVINSIEKEYHSALANEQAIRDTIDLSKSDMQQINRKGYDLSVLEREVESNRQLYDMFLGRLKETSETTGLEKTNARLSDPAVPGIKPIKPKKGLIIAVATFLGLFIGIALSFLLDVLDNSFKRAAEIEDKLGLPVLGLLPHIKQKTEKGKQTISPIQYARENPKSFFSESIRTIRTGVLLSSLDTTHKIILVTSSVAGEGKSTTSTNLANSLSELHRVLLIDADLRRPTVAKNWQLESNALGLSEFVAENKPISDCIHQIGDSDKLFVMPSGQIPPNPLELLSSNRFKEALNKLSEEFDHIVIDAAPLLAVSDSLLLASMASGVVMVVKADSTPIPRAQEAVKRLRKNNPHIIGGVLNDIEETAKNKYGYAKYGNDYVGSYGYTE